MNTFRWPQRPVASNQRTKRGHNICSLHCYEGNDHGNGSELPQQGREIDIDANRPHYRRSFEGVCPPAFALAPRAFSMLFTCRWLRISQSDCRQHGRKRLILKDRIWGVSGRIRAHVPLCFIADATARSIDTDAGFVALWWWSRVRNTDSISLR